MVCHKTYHARVMPLIAGSGDLIANPSLQSNRLAHLLTQRDADVIPGAGHMVHYFAPELVIAAVTQREFLAVS